MEAEIYLHRHKTIIRACRGKRNLKNKFNQVDGNDGAGGASGEHSLNSESSAPTNVSGSQNCCVSEEHTIEKSTKKASDLSQIRTVLLSRNDAKEGLGISITGGYIFRLFIIHLFN